MPDLDLADLCLWLADLKAGPLVARSLRATISTILQCELVLTITCNLIYSDKVVIVAELVNSWEVSVLVSHEWRALL